jgi:hypothetical protein
MLVLVDGLYLDYSDSLRTSIICQEFFLGKSVCWIHRLSMQRQNTVLSLRTLWKNTFIPAGSLAIA